MIKERKDSELYWVIKNGIKMTGMPAFDSTHREDEPWGIVVFVKYLPDLKADQYDLMVKKNRRHGEERNDHHHHY